MECMFDMENNCFPVNSTAFSVFLVESIAKRGCPKSHRYGWDSPLNLYIGWSHGEPIH